MGDGSEEREPDEPLRRVIGVEAPENDPDTQVAQVYARSCGPLIGLLTVMGGSATDAEEIAQDAFVKLGVRRRGLRSADHRAGPQDR